MAAPSTTEEGTVRDHQRHWARINKVLIVVSLLLWSVVGYCGYFVVRRQQLSDEFLQTDCTILSIHTGEKRDCKKCTILHSFYVNVSNTRFDRLFDLCHSSTFPCLTVRVQYVVKVGGHAGHKTIRGKLHEHALQMDEFPECSYTACHNDTEVNRRQVEKYANHWQSVMDSNDTSNCYYNPDKPQQVVVGRRFTRADAVLSIFWPSLAAVSCMLAVILRKTYAAYQKQCCKVTPGDVTTHGRGVSTPDHDPDSDSEDMEPAREADPTQKLPPSNEPHRRKQCVWTVQPLQPPAYCDVVPRDIFSPPPPYEDAVTHPLATTSES